MNTLVLKYIIPLIGLVIFIVSYLAYNILKEECRKVTESPSYKKYTYFADGVYKKQFIILVIIDLISVVSELVLILKYYIK